MLTQLCILYELFALSDSHSHDRHYIPAKLDALGMPLHPTDLSRCSIYFELHSMTCAQDFSSSMKGMPVPVCDLDEDILAALRAEGCTWERYILTRYFAYW